MKRLLILIGMLLALAGMRCSEPDSGDMAKLEDEIRALPPDDYNPLRLWVFEHVVDKYLFDHGHEDAGDLTCFDFGGNVVKKDRLILDEWHACMRGGVYGPPPGWNNLGWDTCTERLRKMFEGRVFNDSKITRCELDIFVGASWLEVVDGAAAENQDQINRAWISLMAVTLIASPTAPPVSLGKLLPFLCGLGAGWGCPGSPGYPGGDVALKANPGGDTGGDQ